MQENYMDLKVNKETEHKLKDCFIL